MRTFTRFVPMFVLSQNWCFTCSRFISPEGVGEAGHAAAAAGSSLMIEATKALASPKSIIVFSM
jgi:hypothetical protein